MLLGKNSDNAFLFSTVIRQTIVVSFPEAVGDSVVSNDVTITSSLRNDVIFRSEFSIFLVRRVPRPIGRFVRNCVYLC